MFGLRHGTPSNRAVRLLGPSWASPFGLAALAPIRSRRIGPSLATTSRSPAHRKRGFVMFGLRHGTPSNRAVRLLGPSWASPFGLAALAPIRSRRIGPSLATTSRSPAHRKRGFVMFGLRHGTPSNRAVRLLGPSWASPFGLAALAPIRSRRIGPSLATTSRSPAHRKRGFVMFGLRHGTPSNRAVRLLGPSWASPFGLAALAPIRSRRIGPSLATTSRSPAHRKRGFVMFGLRHGTPSNCAARLLGPSRASPFGLAALAPIRSRRIGPSLATTSRSPAQPKRGVVIDLRHEAVSRLMEVGLGDQEVAAISGHKSMQMLRRYTHLRAEDLAARVDQLGVR